MRSRITILSGVLLFSLMLPTPAQAGSWSAFIAWLSDLDPKTGGAGLEFTIFCTPPTTDSSLPKPSAPSKFACVRTGDPRLVVKGSAAFLFGTLNDTGGTVFAAPALVIVEKQMRNLYVGAGAGAIHVGGTLRGGITRGLVQANVTYPIPKIQMGVRAELNVILKGFPAGTFRPGGPATGTEAALGISLVFLR
jgi:hypothetical protein